MFNFRTIFFAFAVLFVGNAFEVSAQNDDPSRPPVGRVERMPDGMTLLRQLGLTPQQAQELRKLNQARRPKMEQAMNNFRKANEELDAAIYADTIDEALIAERVSNVDTAQSVLTRLRFENELAIRKILTPDQLVRFREARERIRQVRENMQERRREDGPPMRRGDGPAERQNLRGNPPPNSRLGEPQRSIQRP